MKDFDFADAMRLHAQGLAASANVGDCISLNSFGSAELIFAIHLGVALRERGLGVASSFFDSLVVVAAQPQN